MRGGLHLRSWMPAVVVVAAGLATGCAPNGLRLSGDFDTPAVTGAWFAGDDSRLLLRTPTAYWVLDMTARTAAPAGEVTPDTRIEVCPVGALAAEFEPAAKRARVLELATATWGPWVALGEVDAPAPGAAPAAPVAPAPSAWMRRQSGPGTTVPRLLTVAAPMPAPVPAAPSGAPPTPPAPAPSTPGAMPPAGEAPPAPSPEPAAPAPRLPVEGETWPVVPARFWSAVALGTLPGTDGKPVTEIGLRAAAVRGVQSRAGFKLIRWEAGKKPLAPAELDSPQRVWRVHFIPVWSRRLGGWLHHSRYDLNIDRERLHDGSIEELVRSARWW